MNLKESRLFRAGVFLAASFGGAAYIGKSPQPEAIADCVQSKLESRPDVQVSQITAPDTISVSAYTPLRERGARIDDVFSISRNGTATLKTRSNDMPGDPSAAVGTITLFDAAGIISATKPIDTPTAQQGIWNDRQSEEYTRARQITTRLKACLPGVNQ